MTLQNCLSYLQDCGVRFTHTTHPTAFTAKEVAQVEHMPAHKVAKSVVLRGDEGYVLVVVPADSSVDTEQVRAAGGLRCLKKANEPEIRELFPGSELGAMPALGKLFGLTVYLDREVAEQEFIAFNAGTHRDLIHMRTDDFVELAEAVVGDFCRSNRYHAH